MAQTSKSLTEYEFEFQISQGSVIVTVDVHARNIRDALVTVNSSLRDSANDDQVVAPGMIQHIHFQVKTPITENDLIRVTDLDFNDDKSIEPFKAEARQSA